MSTIDLKTRVTIEDISKPIPVNLDVFIVPNSLMTTNDFMIDDYRERFTEVMTSFMEKRGETFTPGEDLMVQVMYNGMGYKNMVNLGAWVTMPDGSEKHMRVPTEYVMLPVAIFKDKKEGDTVKVELPAYILTNDEEDGYIDLTLDATLHLNQKDYCYRRYGEFQDVLTKLETSYKIDAIMEKINDSLDARDAQKAQEVC